MNIYQNFKQSWQLIRQNKLFSGIYIFGTAIAISMVMVIAIVWLAKTSDIYPETNRSRMMSVKGVGEKGKTTKWKGFSEVSHKMVELIRSTKTLECATEVVEIEDPSSLRLQGEEIKHSAYVKYTDHFFWKVFEFDFIAGSPFSQEDETAKTNKAVISRSMADKYFDGPENALGKDFSIDFIDYHVCGVVKDVSAVMSESFADIWIPIVFHGSFNQNRSGNMGLGYMGSSKIYIMAHSSKDFDNIKEEVLEKVAMVNNASEEYALDLLGQPESYAKGLLRLSSNNPPDVEGYVLKVLIIVLALLLVPSVNMAGMISSRMNKRMEEIGIRKTFGAPQSSILMQVVNENLLLTLIGGVFGILLSYLILFLAGQEIMDILIESLTGYTGDVKFSFAMLMNPWIFVIALIVCVILNLLSALIPAAFALKKNIVDSLNVKK